MALPFSTRSVHLVFAQFSMTSSTLVGGGPFALRPDVVVTLVDDGAVLLDLESKYFYSANHGAWQALALFEVGASFDDVLAHCQRRGANAEDIQALDVMFALLLADGLIEPAQQSGEVHVEASGAWCTPVLDKHKEPLQKIMSSAFDPSIPLAE